MRGLGPQFGFLKQRSITALTHADLAGPALEHRTSNIFSGQLASPRVISARWPAWSAVLPFRTPSLGCLTRPAPECAGESAGFRIAESGCDLGQRHFGVFQQLAGDFEPDLVIEGSVAYSIAPE